MEQYNVTGMSCAACSARVEKAVMEVEGVEQCAVSLLTNSMGVEGSARPEDIIAAVEAAGYGAKIKNSEAREGRAAAPSQVSFIKLVWVCVYACTYVRACVYASMCVRTHFTPGAPPRRAGGEVTSASRCNCRSSGGGRTPGRGCPSGPAKGGGSGTGTGRNVSARRGWGMCWDRRGLPLPAPPALTSSKLGSHSCAVITNWTRSLM